MTVFHTFQKRVQCSACDGRGVAPGTVSDPCQQCGGEGTLVVDSRASARAVESARQKRRERR